MVALSPIRACVLVPISATTIAAPRPAMPEIAAAPTARSIVDDWVAWTVMELNPATVAGSSAVLPVIAPALLKSAPRKALVVLVSVT